MDRILYLVKKIIPRRLFKALQPAYHFLLGWLAALIYRWPSEELVVIGITGTTGKTTSAYLTAKMLESAGFKVGLTSTAMLSDGRKEWLNDKKMTMVGRFFIQRILRRMVNNGCQYAIIETTSEGIRQFRHRFINYDILIFTGLYPEHIESHGSFANYKKAKGELFAHLQRCKVKYADEKNKVVKPSSGIKKITLSRVKKTSIVNGDDEQADYFLSFWSERKLIYMKEGGKSAGEINGLEVLEYNNIDVSDQGTSFVFNKTKINLQLLGEFNAANAMVAACVGLSLGLVVQQIKDGLERIKGVPGRLERIDGGQNFTVIVDHAFEPKAISKLYEAINLIPHQKIIHVLGSAGGGRDTARRPKLGELAGRQADYVIVTNEDPYNDDPEIIIDQVALGADKVGKKNNQNLFRILDRREAIRKALSLAEKSDLVLITGKGSEQAICLADGQKVAWDDRVVAREELGHIYLNI